MGVSARRVEGYYQDLLALKTNAVDDKGHDNSLSNKSSKDPNKDCGNAAEKWKGQIEKVIRCMTLTRKLLNLQVDLL